MRVRSKQVPCAYDLSRVNAAMLAKITEGKWAHLFEETPESLLAVDSDAKTIKGNKVLGKSGRPIKTAVMYLAPHTLSGENLCAMAHLAGCDGPLCLFTAGKGELSSTMAGRLRKTLFFLQHRERFIAMLMKEIAALVAKCEAEGFELVIRLNGTSDIRWELLGIPQAFPRTQFYDYTKLPNRRNVPANYDLTFSYSGTKAYAPHVARAIAAGERIAVVFRSEKLVKAKLARGETFMGLPLIDGDDSDVRHLEPKACVVALYAKGRVAPKDKSGFVQD
jgi:hypothetical protein